jgi:hypothetical protein
MDKYVKNIIEETFASKKQQKYFYAKANDKSLSKKERNKWSKWAKEFSTKTDFEKIPDEVESDVSEIIDDKGNISRKKIPVSKDSKGLTKKTTDEVVKTGWGAMGNHSLGRGGVTSLRYWAEADMSNALGFKKTLGQDVDKEDAEDYFEKELGMNDKESEERLSSYGYDDKLEGDKVRLIENPKKFIQDYVESVLSKKSQNDDLVKKDQNEDVSNELNPIIKKQINALKNTMVKNNLSVKDILKLLNKDDE